jgi:hypothetical protein
MPNVLDLDTLRELYPDAEARCGFLRRARDILQADRVALQQALAQHAYETARELAHRIQGSTAFLAGSTELPIKIFHDLIKALHRKDTAWAQANRASVFRFLTHLEDELARAASD